MGFDVQGVGSLWNQLYCNDLHMTQRSGFTEVNSRLYNGLSVEQGVGQPRDPYDGFIVIPHIAG